MAVLGSSDLKQSFVIQTKYQISIVEPARDEDSRLQSFNSDAVLIES